MASPIAIGALTGLSPFGSFFVKNYIHHSRHTYSVYVAIAGEVVNRRSVRLMTSEEIEKYIGLYNPVIITTNKGEKIKCQFSGKAGCDGYTIFKITEKDGEEIREPIQLTKGQIVSIDNIENQS